MQIGRKIYYEKLTGNVLVDTGERCGSVVETTIEQDFEIYAALKERLPEAVGVMQLEYGQFQQDFTECNGCRVNPETLLLEFSYPNPLEPEAILYRVPLSQEVIELQQRTADLEMALAAMMGGAV